MILRIIGWILRVAELVFGAIVAGVLGSYLRDVDGDHVSGHGRFIYTEVVAGLAIVFALFWLLPFTHGFLHWPADIFISMLWWIAFGLLINHLGDRCGYVFDWNNVRIKNGSYCERWKTTIAFSFLSALCWLVSAIVGFLARRRYQKEHAHSAATTRRRWYHRRSHV